MEPYWHHLKQAPRYGFIAVVATALALPLFGPRDPGVDRENRVHAARPGLPRDWGQLDAFPHEYEAYFGDNFGFRSDLVAANTWLKRSVLGVSASPKAALGKDGWIFLLGDFATAYQRKPGFAPKELEEWTIMLTARKRWLERREIPFLFVAAPDKHTLYPEYLPPVAQPLWKTSPLDQLYGALEAAGEVDTLDLRPALRAAKADGIVYHQLDTHWNDVGCYVAYRTLVEKLNAFNLACGTPLPLSAFTRTEKVVRDGDLAALVGVEGVASSRQPYLERKDGVGKTVMGTVNADSTGLPKEQAYVSYETPGKTLNVMFLRDSFGDRIAPLLAAHCGRLVCGPSAVFNTELILREKPDIVVLERVERYLIAKPEPTPSELLSDTGGMERETWDFAAPAPPGPWSFPGESPAQDARGISLTLSQSGPAALLLNAELPATSVAAVEAEVSVANAETGQPVPANLVLFWATREQIAAAAGQWPFSTDRGIPFSGTGVLQAPVAIHPEWRGTIGALFVGVNLPPDQPGNYRVTVKRLSLVRPVAQSP